VNRAAAATLDHLVLAATTLADGIAYVSELTGLTPLPGGKHPTMGTHNALLRLSPRTYLEVIAIDPAAPKPPHRRWFDLDDIALQAELMEAPRLVHWVARTTDIASVAARCDAKLGEIQSLARGEYRWRLTVAGDGRRPGRGLVPALIEWQGALHPADALPPTPVTLLEFAATHPDPVTIRATLASMGLERELRVTFDRETRLAAMLRTPRGVVTLSS